MKYIFDFDDVLFHTTPQFKEHLRTSLEKAGIPRVMVEEYAKNLQGKNFSLKELISKFSVDQSWYEKIIDESENFINEDVVKMIKKLGRENCYIVSHGHQEFQLDKIKRAKIDGLFTEIVVVPGGKKEAVEEICEKHKGEKIIFIDDKAEHFKGLDFKKYPNLKTILYTGQDLESYFTIV